MAQRLEKCRICGDELVEDECPRGCESEKVRPRGRSRRQGRNVAINPVCDPVQIPVIGPAEAKAIKEAAMTTTKNRMREATVEELQKLRDKAPAVPPKAEETPPGDLPDIAALRSQFQSTQQKKAERLAKMRAEQERQEKMHAQSPETLEFLENEVFPALAEAHKEGDHATVHEYLGIIQRARQNPEVDKTLREREQDATQQRLEEVMARMNDSATVSSAYEGMEAIKANPAAMPTLPAMVIPAGTSIPNARNNGQQNSREFSFTQSPLKEPGAIQIQLFTEKIANRETGDLEPTLFARVIDETKNLHYKEYTYRRGGELGMMRLGVMNAEKAALPPRHYYENGRYSHSIFTVREGNRVNDPHDAVKVALGISYTPDRRNALSELGRKKGIERLEQARAEASVSPYTLVMNGAVGTCVAEGDVETHTLTAALVRHSPESMTERVTRMREVLEAQAKEEGRDLTDEEQASLVAEVTHDVELVAYNPSNAFYAIRGAHIKLQYNNLDPATGKGTVTCWLNKSFMDQSHKPNEALAQVRHLGILLKACVLAEMQPQATEEVPVGQSEEAALKTAESPEPEPAEVAGN